jgi:hypothetical protein
VATRYAGVPIYWVDEASVYCVVWLTFIGASAMTRLRLDFAVTLLTDKLGEKAVRIAKATASGGVLLLGFALDRPRSHARLRHDLLRLRSRLRDCLVGCALREEQRPQRGLVGVLGRWGRRRGSSRRGSSRGGLLGLPGERGVLGDQPAKLRLDLVEEGVDLFLVVALFEPDRAELLLLHVLRCERHRSLQPGSRCRPRRR